MVGLMELMIKEFMKMCNAVCSRIDCNSSITANMHILCWTLNILSIITKVKAIFCREIPAGMTGPLECVTIGTVWKQLNYIVSINYKRVSHFSVQWQEDRHY